MTIQRFVIPSRGCFHRANTSDGAASGEQGIALVKKSAPDLVFLDIRMGA